MDYSQIDRRKIICYLSERCGHHRHDPCYEAAIYILASLDDQSLIAMVSEQGIDFASIIANYATAPSGDRALVKLAAALYDHQQYPANIHDVFLLLTAKQRKTAIWGLLVRYPAITGI